MKRLASLFLVLAMLLTMVSATALADDVVKLTMYFPVNVGGSLWLLNLRPGIIGLPCGNILGNIHKNRSRTSGGGDTKCATHGICQLIHIFYDEVVLGNRSGDSCDIHLLEAILTKK